MQSDNYELTFPDPQLITNLLDAINYLGNKFNCTNELLDWATPLASKIGNIETLELTDFNAKLNPIEELDSILEKPLNVFTNSFVLSELSPYISKSKFKNVMDRFNNNYLCGRLTILQLQEVIDEFYKILLSLLFKKDYQHNVKELLIIYYSTYSNLLCNPYTKDRFMYLQKIGYFPLSSLPVEHVRTQVLPELQDYLPETPVNPLRESSAYLVTKLLLNLETLNDMCILNHPRYFNYLSTTVGDPILPCLVKELTIPEQAIEQFVIKNKDYLTTLYDTIIARKFSYIYTNSNSDNYDFSVDWITCLRNSDILVDFYKKCLTQLLVNYTYTSTTTPYTNIFKLINNLNLDWKIVFQSAILTYRYTIYDKLSNYEVQILNNLNYNNVAELLHLIDLPYEYLYDALVVSLRHDLTFVNNANLSSTEYTELMTSFRNWAFSQTFLEKYTPNTDRKSLIVKNSPQGSIPHVQNTLNYLTNDNYPTTLLIDTYLTLA